MNDLYCKHYLEDKGTPILATLLNKITLDKIDQMFYN